MAGGVRATALVGACMLGVVAPAAVAQAESSDAPTVVVKGRREPPSATDSTPMNFNKRVLSTAELSEKADQKLEEVLRDLGLATTDAASAFGIAPSIATSGFALSKQGSPYLGTTRLYVNGHSDITNGYNRDLSTVESVTLVRGADSTFIGACSPGAILEYRTKRPRWQHRASGALTAATDGLTRVDVDAETVLGSGNMSIGLRVAGAAQRGQTTPEGMPTNRDALFLAASAPTDFGTLTAEAEYLNNRAPFVFGTLYAQGRYWYDLPYVSPQSQALRESRRLALYWDLDTSNSNFRAWWQGAEVFRRETLVGFWSIASPTTLNGYYRERRSSFDQHDLGFKASRTWQLPGLSYQATVQAQQQVQVLDMDAPQSIAGYTISIENPQWPIDLSALKLIARTYSERDTERGYALAHSLKFGPGLELRAGSRASSLHMEAANNSPVVKPTAELSKWIHSAALAWQVNPSHQFWVGAGQSFEPVRGQDKAGNFLAPQLGLMKEAGAKAQWDGQGQHEALLSVFDIEQSNIPAVDPSDKNYLVSLGQVRSTGAHLSWQSQWGQPANPWAFTLNTTSQHVRVTTPVSSSQGNDVPGTPRWYAGFKLRTPTWQGLRSWLGATAVSSRPVDSKATLVAPGYLKWDAGVAYQAQGFSTKLTAYNLADKRYIQALNSVDNMWQGPRRTVAVELAWSR